ncbi:acyl carrier protein [Candidatus Litorirhabdus singularis]|nr:acyl carrier protein [Candidatus Litorirhabdus singularis]
MPQSLSLAIEIICASLQLSRPEVDITANTPLMGAFPDFNSLTIMSIVNAIEEQLGCEIEDEELTAELFESFGTVAAFIDSKLS